MHICFRILLWGLTVATSERWVPSADAFSIPASLSHEPSYNLCKIICCNTIAPSPKSIKLPPNRVTQMLLPAQTGWQDYNLESVLKKHGHVQEKRFSLCTRGLSQCERNTENAIYTQMSKFKILLTFINADSGNNRKAVHYIFCDPTVKMQAWSE